jgi:hypothetical protein
MYKYCQFVFKNQSGLPNCVCRDFTASVEALQCVLRRFYDVFKLECDGKTSTRGKWRSLVKNIFKKLRENKSSR